MGNDFPNRIPVSWPLREGIDKWDYMKLKCFHTTKAMVTRINDPMKNWQMS
jgi:hypothetical protein